MTTVEVINQIKALPPEEQAKVIEFVQGLERDRPRVRTVDAEAFKQASRSVFERHGELMQKLSQ